MQGSIVTSWKMVEETIFLLIKINTKWEWGEKQFELLVSSSGCEIMHIEFIFVIFLSIKINYFIHKI